MDQLIYTSAPRLLESGKTGFGTVACTKGMPKPLISYLERISTFDRAAGIRGLDYYTTYRMGSALFHVFTHVEDCGADYTGRTNHLAQHFVAEEGSQEAAMLQSSTPAAVMKALADKWLREWNSQPGYLPEPAAAPVVTPSSFGAWLRSTGNNDNARWLMATYYNHGCCLSLSGAADDNTRLALLHDGFLHREDRGWGMGFATATVSNLSSGAVPFTFLGEEQRAAGITGGAGGHILSVSSVLQPPTEDDLPRVTKAEPAAIPQPVIIPAAPPQPSIPSPVFPAPEPSHPTAPPRQEEKRGAGNVGSTYIGAGIAAVLVLAGAAVYFSQSQKSAPAQPVEAPQPPAKQPSPPEGGKKEVTHLSVPAEQPHADEAAAKAQAEGEARATAEQAEETVALNARKAAEEAQAAAEKAKAASQAAEKAASTAETQAQAAEHAQSMDEAESAAKAATDAAQEAAKQFKAATEAQGKIDAAVSGCQSAAEDAAAAVKGAEAASAKAAESAKRAYESQLSKAPLKPDDFGCKQVEPTGFVVTLGEKKVADPTQLLRQLDKAHKKKPDDAPHISVELTFDIKPDELKSWVGSSAPWMRHHPGSPDATITVVGIEPFGGSLKDKDGNEYYRGSFKLENQGQTIQEKISKLCSDKRKASEAQESLGEINKLKESPTKAVAYIASLKDAPRPDAKKPLTAYYSELISFAEKQSQSLKGSKGKKAQEAVKHLKDINKELLKENSLREKLDKYTKEIENDKQEILELWKDTESQAKKAYCEIRVSNIDDNIYMRFKAELKTNP